MLVPLLPPGFCLLLMKAMNSMLSRNWSMIRSGMSTSLSQLGHKNLLYSWNGSLKMNLKPHIGQDMVG